MAKSRVEKNKKLYDQLEVQEFEIDDISESKTTNKKEIVENFFDLEDISVEKKEVVKEEVKKEVKMEPVVSKKQELVPVKKPKKNEVAIRKSKKVEIVNDDDFVIEQPISYTDKLSVEEILRARLEKQQELKDRKKGYKKTPHTPNYTPEMMQKNIKQHKGIDIRKEANIKVRRENSGFTMVLLIFLLMTVAIGGTLLIYIIW